MRTIIFVDAYSGHKAEQRPRRFVLDDEVYEIAAVLDHTYAPSAMYFKVQPPPKRLICPGTTGRQTNGHCKAALMGDALLTRSSIELVTVDPATALKAERQIESCEHCHPDDAEIPLPFRRKRFSDASKNRCVWTFVWT